MDFKSRRRTRSRACWRGRHCSRPGPWGRPREAPSRAQTPVTSRTLLFQESEAPRCPATPSPPPRLRASGAPSQQPSRPRASLRSGHGPSGQSLLKEDSGAVQVPPSPTHLQAGPHSTARRTGGPGSQQKYLKVHVKEKKKSNFYILSLYFNHHDTPKKLLVTVETLNKVETQHQGTRSPSYMWVEFTLQNDSADVSLLPAHLALLRGRGPGRGCHGSPESPWWAAARAGKHSGSLSWHARVLSAL